MPRLPKKKAKAKKTADYRIEEEGRKDGVVRLTAVRNRHYAYSSPFFPQKQTLGEWEFTPKERITSDTLLVREVATSWRGKGIGSAMVKRAEEIMRSLGYKKLCYETSKASTARLLANNGYRIADVPSGYSYDFSKARNPGDEIFVRSKKTGKRQRFMGNIVFEIRLK